MGSHTIFDVMNCKAVSSVDELPRGDYVLEPKLDGFRLLAYVEIGGHVEFITRSGKLKTEGKLPHLVQQIGAAFPPGTMLDGEICALRQEQGGYVNDFEYVQGVMLSLPERAVATQEKFGRWLQYVAFDLIKLGEDDVREKPLIERKNTLEGILAVVDLPHVSGMPTFPATQEQHDALVELGFEGSIAKEKSSIYLSGKRGHGWFKLKHQPTVDVAILGYQDGRGKFAGLVGAVEFGQPIRDDQSIYDKKLDIRTLVSIPGTQASMTFVKRGQCSGFDDEERAWVTANRDALIGTVMEVAHMGIYPNGVTMRHPQFKRFRPDRVATGLGWHDG